MEKLTQAEEAELAGEAWTVVQDFKLIGIDVVLIMSGRGIAKVAFSADSAAIAPTMLATAFRDIRKHNAAKAN